MVETQSPIYLYVCYLDMVHSSTKKIDIYEQIERLEILNNSIKFALTPAIIYEETRTLKPYYSGYTGDGAMLCFKDSAEILEFLVQLFHNLSQENKNRDGLLRIRLRAGISSGQALLISQFNQKQKAPWGRDMIIAKRIMDISAPEQILVTKESFDQLKQFHQSRKEFKFTNKGRHKLKHGHNIDVYSLTYKDSQLSFGNNSQPHCDCHWVPKHVKVSVSVV